MSSAVRRATTLSGLVALLALATGTVSAHVKYVTPGSDPVEVAVFLADALTNPFNLAVLTAGALGTITAGLVYLRFRPFPNDVRVFRRTLQSYEDRLPWLLRLAVGLPLVGAGFSGYFFSPVVQPAAPVFVRLFGITIGFLLLFGFGTRLVAAVGLVSYLVALAVEPALLLAFEYVPGFLAIALVGGGRPSADHVVASMAADGQTVYSRIDPFYRRVALPFVERTRHLEAYVPTILRVGLGLTFVYLGVAQKLMEPGDALAVVAKYDLTAVVPVAPELWVVGAGLTELLVGVLLIVGAFTRAASGVAFLLFTTTLFGLPDDPVLAHISLFGLVSALLVTGGGPYSVDAALHETASRTDTDVPPGPTKGD
ncbi:DoxX family protein [Haloferax profundi]|uniref:DoxX family protein n=1 Tax=Haloferax profundi TaxID=1544718 RepID=A0A0W1SMQ5_9EURY|nr:DoxX family protein [Haloferax profundi]KTG27489.1 DoxX family protein [Haloferax profundi]